MTHLSLYRYCLSFFLLCLLQLSSASDKKVNEPCFKKLAQTILAQKQFSHNSTFLIEQTEWRELSLAAYVTMYDTTITAFGTWGLTKLTEPITNMQQLKQRQDTIVQLETDRHMQENMRLLLREICNDQAALLAYFDTHDKLNAKAQHLYYPSWIAAKIPLLNTSKLALDISYMHALVGSVKSLAGIVCMHGFAGEFMDAVYQGRPFELKKVFTRIVHEHSLSNELYDKLQQCSDNPDILKIGTRVFFGGTFGDKCRYGRDLSLAGLRSCFVDYLLPEGLFVKLGNLCGALLAVAERAYFDYEYATNVMQQYRRLRELHATHASLQKRMVSIARCISNIKKLADYWQGLPYFNEQPLFQQISLQLQDVNHPLGMLFQLLQKDTFAREKEIWYSRGDVLLAHKQMLTAKDALVSLLQTVAITDGFMSIVDLYSTHKDAVDDQWCLASFINAPQPVLHIEQGRLPLLHPHAVANDCDLGNSPATSHMLITGPSGAGKSSYLKMIGSAVSCAHSWTIVPARTMQLTPFAHICTSFDPHEDISKGISTFMAQQQRLEKLKQKAGISGQDTYTLLLIDEPYRGTIEAEAEKRAYLLGQTITDNYYTLAVMACHLQEPIMLQEHTGRWCNKHVVIQQLADFNFKCMYVIADGPAWWWFNDLTQRMKFIDWLLIK